LNNTVSPDGKINGTLLSNQDPGTGTLIYSYYHSNISLIQNTQYTLSCYAKYKAGSGFVWLLCEVSGDAFVMFDILNGVAVNLGTGVQVSSSSIEDAGNGWFRISATFTKTSAGAGEQIGIGVSPTSTQPNWNATGLADTQQAYVYGFQLEAGSFPTSYIETTGVTATRALDEAFISVDAFGFNSNLSGTLSVEGTFIGDPYNQVYGFLATLGSAINDTRFLVRAGLNDITDRVHFVATDATGTTVAVSFLVDLSQNAKNTVNKITASFGNGQYFGAANGLTGSTTYTGELWTPSQIEIGRHGFSYTTTCHIKSITYYPRRLTDAQIQRLTQPISTPTLSLTFDGQATSFTEDSIHG
jgi:hypothetical protein